MKLTALQIHALRFAAGEDSTPPSYGVAMRLCHKGYLTWSPGSVSTPQSRYRYTAHDYPVRNRAGWTLTPAGEEVLKETSQLFRT